jgi:hypothetical protein
MGQLRNRLRCLATLDHACRNGETPWFADTGTSQSFVDRLTSTCSHSVTVPPPASSRRGNLGSQNVSISFYLVDPTIMCCGVDLQLLRSWAYSTLTRDFPLTTSRNNEKQSIVRFVEVVRTKLLPFRERNRLREIQKAPTFSMPFR